MGCPLATTRQPWLMSPVPTSKRGMRCARCCPSRSSIGARPASTDATARSSCTCSSSCAGATPTRSTSAPTTAATCITCAATPAMCSPTNRCRAWSRRCARNSRGGVTVEAMALSDRSGTVRAAQPGRRTASWSPAARPFRTRRPPPIPAFAPSTCRWSGSTASIAAMSASSRSTSKAMSRPCSTARSRPSGAAGRACWSRSTTACRPAGWSAPATTSPISAIAASSCTRATSSRSSASRSTACSTRPTCPTSPRRCRPASASAATSTTSSSCRRRNRN